MNIFYLDEDIDKCAEAHLDKHVTKMQLELGQMLSTNLWIDEVLGYTPRKVTSDETATIRSVAMDTDFPTSVRYKPCFYNHPCTIWMRTSHENWEYSWLLVDALGQEAQWRGFNPHKSHAMVLQLPHPTRMESLGFTKPAQAMPDTYNHENSVKAYRDYYLNEKASIARWTRRNPPSWWWRSPKSEKNYLDAKGLRDRAENEDTINQWQRQMDEIILLGRINEVPDTRSKSTTSVL